VPVVEVNQQQPARLHGAAYQTCVYSIAYLTGISLFNSGYYWHAHEAWEDCWRTAQPADADFYQGLIQAAAALVKWHQGNRHGAELNWAKSRARLSGLPETTSGLHIPTLIDHMDKLIAGETITAPLLVLTLP
jgi:predicted metal-dependent hydrolase